MGGDILGFVWLWRRDSYEIHAVTSGERMFRSGVTYFIA